VLTGELETFQVKITAAANDVYGTWREGTHDDMVLATALAAWYGCRPRPIACPLVMGAARDSRFSVGLFGSSGSDRYISTNGGDWRPARQRITSDHPLYGATRRPWRGE
jgi:hypothetical protein